MLIDSTNLIQVLDHNDGLVPVATLSGPMGDLTLQAPSGIIQVPSVLNATGGILGVSTVTATGTITARASSDRFAETLNVLDFGALFDGSSHPLSATYGTLAAAQAVYPHAVALTDEIDGVAVQAAINRAKTLANGAVIDFPNGVGLVNRALVVDQSNIVFRGRGMTTLFHDLTSAVETTSTTLKWTGASGATVVTIAPPTDAVNGKHMANNGVWGGLVIDGNSLADTCWRIASTNSGEYHLGFIEPTGTGVLFDTIALGEFNDPQHNEVWITGLAIVNSPTGVVLDGTGSGGAQNGNTSLNQFRDIGLKIKNGDGIHFNYCDHNLFDFVSVSRRSGGTGNALVFNGSNVSSGHVGYSNKINYFTSNAPSVAKGTSTFTFPSTGNWIVWLDLVNSTPIPTMETGATLLVGTDGRVPLAMMGSTAGVQAHIADTTASGGNSRGANSVDLQTSRTANTQVASGTNSIIAGGVTNTASGQSTLVWGTSCQASAIYAVAGGHNSTASGNESVAIGEACTALGGASWSIGSGAHSRNCRGQFSYADGFFSTAGDAQMEFHVLTGTGNSTSAIRCTSANLGAGSTTVVNLRANSAMLVTVDILALDHTTVSKNMAWKGWSGLLTQGANAAATAVTMDTKPTPFSNGTVTGADVSVTADTTNGGLNVSFTPPTGNTDTWNVVVRVSAIVAQ